MISMRVCKESLFLCKYGLFWFFFDDDDDDDDPNPRPDKTQKEDVENDWSDETQEAKQDVDRLEHDPGH